MSHDEIGMAFHRHQMQLSSFDEIIEEMLLETFEERAGIREFDGQFARTDAEALARAEMESHIKALERAELIAAGEA